MFSISFWSINSPQEMMLHFQWKLSKRSQRTTVLRSPMKTECFLSQMTMKNGCCSSRCFKWCHWRLRAFSPVFNDNEKQSMLIGMILFMSQKTRGNKTVAQYRTMTHTTTFCYFRFSTGTSIWPRIKRKVLHWEYYCQSRSLIDGMVSLLDQCRPTST